MTTTSLAQAIDSTSEQNIHLASATGVVAQTSFLLIDQELMSVTALTGSIARVVRGASGTVATTHSRNTAVSVLTASEFAQSATGAVPSGADTPATSVLAETQYGAPASFQQVAVDLDLDAAAGKDSTSSAFLAPVMGNIHGDSLTKTGNYLAGVIGEDSITGAQATIYAKGGVLGIIADGVTAADGAVVAILDGDDGGTTTPNAMFKAVKLNSTPGNDPDYGVDLKSSVSGFSALVPKKADLRMADDVCFLHAAGVPSTAGTGCAGKGSLYVDITNGKLYINGGSSATPSWKIVTSA